MWGSPKENCGKPRLPTTEIFVEPFQNINKSSCGTLNIPTKESWNSIERCFIRLCRQELECQSFHPQLPPTSGASCCFVGFILVTPCPGLPSLGAYPAKSSDSTSCFQSNTSTEPSLPWETGAKVSVHMSFRIMGINKPSSTSRWRFNWISISRSEAVCGLPLLGVNLWLKQRSLSI